MKAFCRVLCILFTLTAIITTVPSVYAEEGGLRFSAQDAYLPVKGLTETPNTLEAWIRLPASAASSRGGVIVGNYGAGRSVINFEIHKNGNPRLYWTDSKGETADWTFSGVNVCTGEWVHVCIVRDVGAGKVHCYVDGSLKRSMPIAADLGREDTLAASGLCIGGDLRGDNAQYFKGEIRGIALYSAVRTGEDIAAAAENGLIARYELTSASAKTAIGDLSGNGYDIRYSQNKQWVGPREVSEPADYAYSFAVIGDTQVMNETYPDKFGAIYDWILENIEEKKIKFVLGLGDITNKSGADEWARAKAAIHSLDGKVEYNLVRGNHDSIATYTQAFPWKDYKDIFDGSFNNSMLYTYRTLEIGDIKYLFITLDYGANDKALEWAGKLCEEYSDHNVIITTHAYLFRDGTTLDENDVCPPSDSGNYNNGDDMWDKLVSRHENIVLVISGHDPCDRVVATQTKGNNGNTVTQMLIDPQGSDKNLGGLGMVAMLYFSEDGRDVTVQYYSTTKKLFYRSINQFSLTLDTVTAHAEGSEEVTEAPQTEPPQTEAPVTQATETATPVTEAPDSSGAKNNTAVIIIVSAAAGAAISAGTVLAVIKAKKKER